MLTLEKTVTREKEMKKKEKPLKEKEQKEKSDEKEKKVAEEQVTNRLERRRRNRELLKAAEDNKQLGQPCSNCSTGMNWQFDLL